MTLRKVIFSEPYLEVNLIDMGKEFICKRNYFRSASGCGQRIKISLICNTLHGQIKGTTGQQI